MWHRKCLKYMVDQNNSMGKTFFTTIIKILFGIIKRYLENRKGAVECNINDDI